MRYLLRRGLLVYYDADWSLLALTDGLNLLTEDGGALFSTRSAPRGSVESNLASANSTGYSFKSRQILVSAFSSSQLTSLSFHSYCCEGLDWLAVSMCPFGNGSGHVYSTCF